MIKLERFMGVAPRYAPQILPENAAQVAQNCRFDSGALRPMKGLSDQDPALDITAGATSLFLYERSGMILLSFVDDTDVVRSPIAKDAWGRVYISNGGVPKMRAAGSSSLWDLGVQVPGVNFMSATIDSSGRTSEDPLDATDRFYVMTYVSAYDEEGPPSVPYSVPSVYPGDVVNIGALATTPVSGVKNYDRKRIYRTNTGSMSTEYQLVATLPIATTSYVDSLEDTALGVVLPSVTWDAPPEGIKGFVAHPSGFILGFKGRTIYASELYLPHAWPYSYPVSEDIVALAVYGNTVIVLTTGAPVLLTGGTPDSLYLEKTETSLACLSKRAVVDMGDLILYPSPEGLVVAGLGSPPEIATKALLDKDQWALYSPESMLATQWDRKYVAFCHHAERGHIALMFDPQTKDLSEIVVGEIKACLYDHNTGRLAVKRGNELYLRYFGEGELLTYAWRSKVFRKAMPENYGAAQIFADSYPVYLRVYADAIDSNTPIYSVDVTSQSPVRLPSGFLADKWELQLEGTASINTVHVAPTMRDLKRME